jgi:hypothetical protein
MLAEEILERLKSYIAGNVSLDDFEAWFVPATLEVHRSSEHEAQVLAATINLWFAEFTNGDRTAAELRDLFEGLLPRVQLEPSQWLVPGPASSGSGALTGTIRHLGASAPIWSPRIEQGELAPA